MTRFWLPLIHSETLLSDGSRREHSGVVCPRVSHIIDADRCPGCPYVANVSSTDVVCAPPVPALPRGDEAPAASCSSLMFSGAEQDVLMRRIFGSGAAPSMVPVVDEDDRFLGFVEAPEAGATELPPRLARTLPAEALIFGRSLWIRDGTPVRAALRTMAARHSRVLALLDEQGRLRGLLHDVDALRAVRACDTGMAQRHR
jgi:CBS domain-containing protein